MEKRNTKSLEDTIRELHKRYKNTASPLLENNRFGFVTPPQKIGGPQNNPIFGDFKPTPKSW